MNGITRLKIKQKNTHTENRKNMFSNIIIWFVLFILTIGSLSLITLGGVGIDSFIHNSDFWVTSDGIIIFLSIGIPLCLTSFILMGIWNKVTKRSHQWESLIG